MTKTFEALASGETLELRIYGAIGAGLFFGGATAAQVADAIKYTQHKRIVLKINSPGGDAFEGVAIRNILAAQAVETIAEIEGRAASAASIAALGCKHIRMFTGSAMMIHEASGLPNGPMDSRAVKKLASALETLNDSMASLYASRTGKSKKECRTMMSDETWLNPEQAVKQGFADEYVDEKKEDALKVAASFDWKLFGYQVPQFNAEGDPDETVPILPPKTDDDEKQETPPPAAVPPIVDPPAQVPPQTAASAEASARRTRLDRMTIKLIAAAAGLSADADESAVISAVQQLHAFASELQSLTKASSRDAVLGAIRGLQETATQVPVLTATVAEQAKKLEDQERAAILAADKAAPEGRRVTPVAEAWLATQSLDVLKGYIATTAPQVKVQNAANSNAGQQQQPAPQQTEATGVSTTAAGVVTHDGKAWEQFTPGELHDLKFTNEQAYSALLASYVERGRPRAQSQQQRASA